MPLTRSDSDFSNMVGPLLATQRPHREPPRHKSWRRIGLRNTNFQGNRPFGSKRGGPFLSRTMPFSLSSLFPTGEHPHTQVLEQICTANGYDLWVVVVVACISLVVGMLTFMVLSPVLGLTRYNHTLIVPMYRTALIVSQISVQRQERCAWSEISPVPNQESSPRDGCVSGRRGPL